MEDNKEYYAFISYKREDEKWAKWLQHKLEHYRFPMNLNCRTDLPKNIRPTFRDVTDLKPGLLAEEIDNALRNSQWLIVVCSPRSAKSLWVCKEAQTFIDLGRADRIIPFVIEGSPFSDETSAECYPEALLNLIGSRELLATNINEMGRDAAAIKVVARMFGLRFDALWQRHKRMLIRRISAIISVLLLVIVLIGIGAAAIKKKNVKLLDQATIIEQQMFELKKANQLQLIQISRSYMLQGKFEMAIYYKQKINDEYLGDSTSSMLLGQLIEDLDDSLSLDNHQIVKVYRYDGQNKHPNIDSWSNGCLSIVGDDSSTLLYYKDTLAYGWTMKQDGIISHVVPSYDSNIIAVMGYSGLFGIDTTTIGGIAVVSLNKKKLIGHIDCGGWFDFLSYPVAVSSNGRYLIYKEGWRMSDGLFLVDFNTNKRIQLRNWDGSSETHPQVAGCFSPDDKYYYIAICSSIWIYETRKNGLVDVIEFEKRSPYEWDMDLELSDVEWCGNNCMRIVYDGLTYEINVEEKPRGVQIPTDYPASAIALSDDGSLVAAVFHNGNIKIWEASTGKLIQDKSLDQTSLDDVAFTHNAELLWASSGYGGIAAVNVKSGEIINVDSVTALSGCYYSSLYITPDDKYCLLEHCDVSVYEIRNFKLVNNSEMLSGNIVLNDGSFFSYKTDDWNLEQSRTRRRSKNSLFEACVRKGDRIIIKDINRGIDF